MIIINNDTPNNLNENEDIENAETEEIIYSNEDKTQEETTSHDFVMPSIPSYLLEPSPAFNAVATSLSNFVANYNRIESTAISVLQTVSDRINSLFNNQFVAMLENMSSALVSLVQSPFMNWLQTLDMSPFIRALESLTLDDDDIDNYKLLDEAYLYAMYECKWFPYAGCLGDFNLYTEVCEIISTSRGVSKRREKRIDKAVLAYYTDKEVKKIKSRWWKSDLDYCLRRTLCQAINAYLRKEYVLTISCLATMWEGLIYMKAHNVPPEERHRQRMEITKQELSELTAANDYDNIFSDYFKNYIVSQCNEVADVVEGVPNRHGTSHSWYKKYPNKKAALNAILLTDFILRLKPKEESEEESNGEA